MIYTIHRKVMKMKKHVVYEYEKSDFEEIFDYVKEQKTVDKEELWKKFKHTWESWLSPYACVGINNRTWQSIDDLSMFLRYTVFEKEKLRSDDCYLYELKAGGYNNANLIYQKGLDKDLEELEKASSCFDDSGYHQDRIPRETAIKEVKKAGLEKWLPFCTQVLSKEVYDHNYLDYRWRAANLHQNLWDIINLNTITTKTHFIQNPLPIQQTLQDYDNTFYVRLPFLIEIDKIIQINRIKKECKGKFEEVPKKYIDRLTEEYGENFVNQIKTELK